MIYMPFLYFPEDKSEYIPAIIMFIIFMILAVIVFYFIVKKSKKDEVEFSKQYKERLEEIEKETKEKH